MAHGVRSRLRYGILSYRKRTEGVELHPELTDIIGRVGDRLPITSQTGSLL